MQLVNKKAPRMSKLNTVSVFLQQVRIHTDSDVLVEWYKEFLASRELPVQFVSVSRSEELLGICTNLFFLSQEVANAVVHGAGSHSALEVANSVCMHAAIDAILHKNFAGKQLVQLSELFDDALFWLSAPRITENALLSRAMLDFVAKIHIPHSFTLVLGGEECSPIENEKPILALLAKMHAESGIFGDVALDETLAALDIDIRTACSFYNTLSGPKRRLLDATLEKSCPAQWP